VELLFTKLRKDHSCSQILKKLTWGELKNNMGKSKLLPFASSSSTFSARLEQASQGYPKLRGSRDALACMDLDMAEMSVLMSTTLENRR
jgi:hypothetical protein